LGAQLLLFREICQSVGEGFRKCSPEKRGDLAHLIHLAIGSAEEAVQILRAKG
jgi:hypothetical protein